MKIVRRAEDLLEMVRAARRRGADIGFVPTMGFLHEGHLSLVRRARRAHRVTVASIFVNPLQFGPAEDLAAYPSNLARDHGLLRAEGVDLLFEPRSFYPDGFATRLRVERVSAPFCGAYRPGHFEGVATVVAKLLLAAEPDCLYLGRKDYQQAVVIRRMIRDLGFPVRVVICPTIREADGLAMSSRNAYLTESERLVAPRLHGALKVTARAIARGSIRSAKAAESAVRRELRGTAFRLQYADVRAAKDLAEVRPLSGQLVLAAAAYLGRARLIDNLPVRAPLGRKGEKPE